MCIKFQRTDPEFGNVINCSASYCVRMASHIIWLITAKERTSTSWLSPVLSFDWLWTAVWLFIVFLDNESVGVWEVAKIPRMDINKQANSSEHSQVQSFVISSSTSSVSERDGSTVVYLIKLCLGIVSHTFVYIDDSILFQPGPLAPSLGICPWTKLILGTFIHI